MNKVLVFLSTLPNDVWIFLGICAVFIALFFYVLGFFVRHLKVMALRSELDKQNALHHEKLTSLEQANEQIKDNFANLSKHALKENRESFLSLAQTELSHHLQKQHLASKMDLDKREQSIASMVKPIKDALSKADAQLREIEKERVANVGSLKQQLHTLAETQSALQSETRNLVTALRRPEVRGQWGEMTLKRIAELSGMVEHCDFTEQTSVQTDDGLQRPDLIVRMPDHRELVVDAKTPLDAYLTAVQASTEADREEALKNHAKIVKNRIKELAQKSYWKQFKNAPDYVVLFIPGEQFLSSALDVDHNLMEYALSNRIILSTPTSLVALLRAVAFGWRQHSVAENAEHIQQLGEALYHRISTFTEHMNKLSGHLDKSVEFFNKAVGSVERNILPSARKLTELGIEEKKTLSDPQSIERKARQLDEPPTNKET